LPAWEDGTAKDGNATKQGQRKKAVNPAREELPYSAVIEPREYFPWKQIPDKGE